MGTDIHALVEIKRPRYRDGSLRWLQLDEELFDGWKEDAKVKEPFYTIRNYTLFALLAGVRNGVGFAGVDTGDAIQPLSEPRGVAEDASHAWREVVEYWDVDMHSHSYFTLEELLSPKFEALYRQRLVRRGVITEEQYLAIKRDGGQPTDWSGAVWGGASLTVTPEQYDAGMRGESSTYINWVWEDDLHASTHSLHETIAQLKAYADDHYGDTTNYADLRLCFGFDN